MTATPRHSVSVAGVTIRDDGRILVVQRRDNGRWEAPGGVLELDETFEQGVVREVAEETGVTVAVDHLSGVYKNMTLGVVALVYRCHYVSGEPAPTPESQRVEWQTIDEIQERTTPAYAVRILDALTGVPASRAHDGVQLTDHGQPQDGDSARRV